MKGDQFHTISFNYYFCYPSNYSRNNWFLTDPTFVVRTKGDSAKSCYLKILYKLYTSSIEQSGYHTVVKSSESYKVSLKDITALEKR